VRVGKGRPAKKEKSPLFCREEGESIQRKKEPRTNTVQGKGGITKRGDFLKKRDFSTIREDIPKGKVSFSRVCRGSRPFYGGEIAKGKRGKPFLGRRGLPDPAKERLKGKRLCC